MLHKYIAAAIAVAVFIFVFFSGRFFPQLYIFNLFTNEVFRAQDVVRGTLDSSDTTSAFTIDNNMKTSDLTHIAIDETLVLDSAVLSSVLASRPNEPVSVFDIRVGGGAEAVSSRSVSIGYRGVYIDEQTGKEILFDENTDSSLPFTFALNTGLVIPGFDIGVSGMREGGVRLVVIEPEMGYGSQQAGSIPPNTTLIFVIELYEVQ